MRLDPDCIRDILLCVEEHTGVRRSAVFVDTDLSTETAAFLGNEPNIQPYQEVLMQTHSCEKLIYHINHCAEAGLIRLSDMSAGDTIWVEDLTHTGHELLSKIRDESHWEPVMKILSHIKDYSLSAITAVSEGVTSAAISAYFSGKS